MAKTAKATERPLTLKQQIWLNEYLSNGGNGTQAARIAKYGLNMPEGPKKENYLALVANQNRRKYNIKAIIDSKTAKMAEKLEITIETQIKKSQAVIDAATLKGDFNAVNTAIMAQSKHLGLIVDKSADVTTDQQRELTEHEQEAARELIRHIFEQKVG